MYRKDVVPMKFYDHSKEERKEIIKRMEEEIGYDIETCTSGIIRRYASDSDTYIRKNAYLVLGRLYRHRKDARERIISTLGEMLDEENEKVRQTAVYALGEIGKSDADSILGMLERALGDEHHSVRNAVIGALKQMGNKNPGPTLSFARRFLHHPDPRIRREIVHGIELRGRMHPCDVLPLLEEVQHDPDREVRKTVIHVLAQISYKKGCLEKVIPALEGWENRELVGKAVEGILATHRQYARFCALSFEEARALVDENLQE